MSEIQNRAIEVFHRQTGSTPVTNEEFRRQLLQGALALYRALGGTEAAAQELLQGSLSKGPKDVATSVGDLVVALAGVSYLQDIDMVQAGYNTLNDKLRRLPRVSCGQNASVASHRMAG